MDGPLTAYEGDGSFVFVSYSHGDDEIVYPEIRWLQDQGFNVCYDEGISGASRWRDAIADNIAKCSLSSFMYLKILCRLKSVTRSSITR